MRKRNNIIKDYLQLTINLFFAKKEYRHSLALLLVAILLLQSCSNTKFLTNDEKLYTYTWFRQKGFGKIKNKPLKAYELYSIGRVKTNRAFVGLPRTKLLVYNYMKPSGKFGPRHYIYKVMAQPPVLLKEINPELRTKVMNQKLDEMGHFDSYVNYDTKYYGKGDKKARTKYLITFKPAYTYRNITFIPSGKNFVDTILIKSFENKKLKPGDDYWLKNLKEERERLTTDIKNRGYYYFKPEYLQFFADSTVGNKQVDLKLLIKDNIPPKSFSPYKVDQVNIVIESRKKQPHLKEPIFINNLFYYDESGTFKAKIISDCISITPGKEYTLTDHENTIKYLQGLGAFSTINISYSPLDSLNISRSLAANIRLKPLQPVQTNLEVNFSTKSNDFLGPSATASISHLNLFGGAENLTLEVDGGFEWQKRSKRKQYELGLNSYVFGTNLKLLFPRFIVPFNLQNQSKRYVPKTYTSIGFHSLQRVKYYTMNVAQIKFGYNWQSSPKREFKVEPISIDYFHLPRQSQEFIDFLVKYPQVALSFNEQFIFGSQYSYTYSTKSKRRKLNYFYYKAKLDLSGNILQSIYSLTGNKNSASAPNTLLGIPFAQYTKIKNDFRYYIYFHEKSQIATRLIVGVGVPYQNSSVLPYAKQFFAGGSQDIRAFYARSIGPGSYFSTNPHNNGSFLDQSGEIKLMSNIEYRFPISYRINGALFTDAGNVWLINEDPSRPGGKFKFNSFLGDIAIGAGAGIRVDLDYFIIRLDGAIPIRKPYLSGSQAWIFNDISFFHEFIFSLAIGYPF